MPSSPVILGYENDIWEPDPETKTPIPKEGDRKTDEENKDHPDDEDSLSRNQVHEIPASGLCFSQNQRALHLSETPNRTAEIETSAAVFVKQSGE